MLGMLGCIFRAGITTLDFRHGLSSPPELLNSVATLSNDAMTFAQKCSVKDALDSRRAIMLTVAVI